MTAICRNMTQVKDGQFDSHVVPNLTTRLHVRPERAKIEAQVNGVVRTGVQRLCGAPCRALLIPPQSCRELRLSCEPDRCRTDHPSRSPRNGATRGVYAVTLAASTPKISTQIF